MLHNGRLPGILAYIPVHVFFNLHVQSLGASAFPNIHLTALAGDLVDHTCQLLLGEGVLFIFPYYLSLFLLASLDKEDLQPSERAPRRACPQASRPEARMVVLEQPPVIDETDNL